MKTTNQKQKSINDKQKENNTKNCQICYYGDTILILTHGGLGRWVILHIVYFGGGVWGAGGLVVWELALRSESLVTAYFGELVKCFGLWSHCALL